MGPYNSPLFQSTLAETDDEEVGASSNNVMYQSRHYVGPIRESRRVNLPFMTLEELPVGLAVGFGGIVGARSVKLFEEVEDKDPVEAGLIRSSWWSEIREEMRSHVHALACNAVLAYKEDICVRLEEALCSGEWPPNNAPFKKPKIISNSRKDVCILSVTGTAVRLDDEWKTLQDGDGCGNSACAALHTPFASNPLPFPIKLTPCPHCCEGEVGDVILGTCEPIRQFADPGTPPKLIQIPLVRRLQHEDDEELAKEISNLLPFVEHELHSNLLADMESAGYNSAFTLRINFAIGEKVFIAVLTATMASLMTDRTDLLLATHSLNVEDGPAAAAEAVLNGLKIATNGEVDPLLLMETDDLKHDLSKGSLDLTYPNHSTSCFVVGKEATTISSTKNQPSQPFSKNAGKDDAIIAASGQQLHHRVASCMNPNNNNSIENGGSVSSPQQQQQGSADNREGGWGTPQLCLQVWRGTFPSDLLGTDSASETVARTDKADSYVKRKIETLVKGSLYKLRTRHRLGGESGGVGARKRRKARELDTLLRHLMLNVGLLEEGLMTGDNELQLVFTGMAFKPQQRDQKDEEPIEWGDSGSRGIFVSTLPYPPTGKTVQSYLGRVDAAFIRETTDAKEHGGVDGFIRLAISEVFHCIRSYVLVAGGTGLLSLRFSLNQFIGSTNHAQCLIAAHGDIVTFTDMMNAGTKNGSLIITDERNGDSPEK